MEDIKDLNDFSKILLVVLSAIIGYFFVFLIMNFILVPQPQTSMTQMMSQMMGTRFLNFSTINYIIVNLFSLLIAGLVGFLISLYLFKSKSRDEEKEREHKILRRVLSEDERKIFDEIKKSGEITQDSLRFRLGWSKAKISTILTNLDKSSLIQRERIGKTYKVWLQKSIS